MNSAFLSVVQWRLSYLWFCCKTCWETNSTLNIEIVLSQNWTSVSSYSPVNLAFHQESDCVLLLGILPRYFFLELQKIFTLKILETSGSFPWQSCASIHYIFLFKNRQMKTFCLMKEKQLWLAQEFMKAYKDDSNYR